MSIDVFRKQLKEGTAEGIYYLLGEEQFLLDRYYEQAKEACAPIFPELNLIELDGKKLDFEFFADGIASYPAMSDKKLVSVLDFDSSTLKGDGAKKMAAAFGEIAPGVTVIFRDHAKEKGKANALEALIKKNGGMIVRVEKPSPAALNKWIHGLAEKSGVSISDADCSYLAELTGSSMLRISIEMKKLAAFSQGGIIERETIEKMVAPEEEAAWFAVSNAVCEHDFDALMQAVDLLYRQNVDDTVIAGMFYRTFIDLWRGLTALREGVTSQELASTYGISPYAAARMMRSATKLKEGEVLEGLRSCKELDRKIKSSGGNKKDLIYGFITELLEFQMRGHE